MAVTINGSYPDTYDSDDVYDDQGYGWVINFEEEDSGGNTSPLDLTNYTPVIYRLQKADDENVFEKRIEDGQTSGDGMVIQGSNNEQLSISIPSTDTQVRAKRYRHELQLTKSDGSPLFIFIGDVPLKNLFSQ